MEEKSATKYPTDENEVHTSELDSRDIDEGTNQDTTTQSSKKEITTHYIFLVHGWMGDAKEMLYFEQSLHEKINHLKKGGISSPFARIRIHSSTCNEGKTSDGVINGGRRLAQEIKEYIEKDISQWYNETEPHTSGNDSYSDDNGLVKYEIHVTISIIGNSLGGLYSRYSLSCIPSKIELDIPLPTGGSFYCVINVHSNIFMTTVAPHLGLANNCSFKTSQIFEHLSARMTGQSGVDLFLLDQKKKSKNRTSKKKNQDKSLQNDCDGKESIVFAMATDYDRFLKPLMKFQKRVAYINSFNTDFQVHTTTAGFFSKRSTYPHVFSVANNNVDDKHHPFVIAQSTTEQNEFILQSKTPSFKQMDGLSYKRKEEIKIQDLIMSNKLDALGWTKVFVDSRDMNPIKTLRKAWYSNTSRNLWDEFVSEMRKSQSTSRCTASLTNYDKASTNKSARVLMIGQFNTEDEDEDTLKEDSISIFMKQGNEKERNEDATFTATSKDLFHYMTFNERFQVPVGHSLLIANSKSPFYEKLNRNGRPIVDYIVENLVKDVVQFNSIEDKT